MPNKNPKAHGTIPKNVNIVPFRTVNIIEPMITEMHNARDYSTIIAFYFTAMYEMIKLIEIVKVANKIKPCGNTLSYLKHKIKTNEARKVIITGIKK